MREREGQGATCVLLAAAHSLVGAFAIKDPLKPEVIPPLASWIAFLSACSQLSCLTITYCTLKQMAWKQWFKTTAFVVECTA